MTAFLAKVTKLNDYLSLVVIPELPPIFMYCFVVKGGSASYSGHFFPTGFNGYIALGQVW
jgi:hypothetical protein